MCYGKLCRVFEYPCEDSTYHHRCILCNSNHRRDIGKVVPEIVKVRKYFKRKKLEKQEAAKRLEEMYELNKEVKLLLGDVNAHYSADNIAKRDSWMQWVNDRAVTYDTFIKDMRSE